MRSSRSSTLPFDMAKRARKSNFSESEVAKLLEEVSLERTLLMSSFQNTVTNKKKDEVWVRIVNAVNAVGGCGRSVKKVRKKWKDLKAAVINKPMVMSATGGGGKTPDVPYEDLIMGIIGEGSHLTSGIPGSTLTDTWHDEAAAETAESVFVPVIDFQQDTMHFPEGPTIHNIDIHEELPSTSTGGYTLPQRPASTPPRIETKAARKQMPAHTGKSAKKTIFSMTSASSSFMPDAAQGGPRQPPSSSSTAHAMPAKLPGKDMDEVWHEWMQSEISNNKIKEKLLTVQLESAEEQKLIMDLQKKSMKLKIKAQRRSLGYKTDSDS